MIMKNYQNPEIEVVLLLDEADIITLSQVSAGFGEDEWDLSI